MDFGWASAAPLSPSGHHAGADLNLLGDNLLIDLDDKTLQCLMGGNPSFAQCMGSLPGEASGSGSKRPREPEGEIAPAALDDEDDESNDEAADGKGKGGGRGKAKRGKGADAASVKACREKARREKLNECFEELARLCDPSGKMTRTDRISIVQDAIRALTVVRAENNQLRQLNKFLEERVRQYEAERAQGMYQAMSMQQHMMMAQQQQQQQQAAPPAAAQQTQQQQGQLTGAPSGSLPAAGSGGGQPPAADGGCPQHAQQAQQQAQQQPQMFMPPAGMMLVPVARPGAAMMAPHPGAGMANHYYGMKAEPIEPSLLPTGGAGMPMSSFSAQHNGTAYVAVPAAGMAMGGGAAAANGGGGGVNGAGPGASGDAGAGPSNAPPQVLPADAPPVAWLPAPDISQDQKLRPPAA